MNILVNSGSDAEIATLEAELAENRKATKNIMSAIEQGIFTATTKDRLLELEANISSLEKSIALAKAARENRAITKEHIIWHLQKLKDGDIQNKDFQKSLISAFVKSVYLWDDRIEIDYDYTGKGHSLSCSLSDLGSGSTDGPKAVRIDDPEPHHIPTISCGMAGIFIYILYL